MSLVDLVHRRYVDLLWNEGSFLIPLPPRIVNYEGRVTAYLGHRVFELDSRADRKLFLCHYHIPHLSRYELLPNKRCSLH